MAPYRGVKKGTKILSQEESETKEIDWFEQGVIPGLLYFQNGGEFTGSVSNFENKAVKEFRYKLGPGEGAIKAEVWYGPCCYGKSEIVDLAEFSLDSGGHSEMLGWMKEKYESMVE